MKYNKKEIIAKLKAVKQYDNYLDESDLIYAQCLPASEIKPILNRLLSEMLNEAIELDWRTLNNIK